MVKGVNDVLLLLIEVSHSFTQQVALEEGCTELLHSFLLRLRHQLGQRIHWFVRESKILFQVADLHTQR